MGLVLCEYGKDLMKRPDEGRTRVQALLMEEGLGKEDRKNEGIAETGSSSSSSNHHSSNAHAIGPSGSSQQDSINLQALVDNTTTTGTLTHRKGAEEKREEGLGLGGGGGKRHLSLNAKTSNSNSSNSRNPRPRAPGTWRLVLSVIWTTLCSPLMVMSFLGVITNLVFGARVPTPLLAIFTTLGGVFTPVSLFLLGMKMDHVLRHKVVGWMEPIAMATARQIVQPILACFLTRVMCRGL